MPLDKCFSGIIIRDHFSLLFDSSTAKNLLQKPEDQSKDTTYPQPPPQDKPDGKDEKGKGDSNIKLVTAFAHPRRPDQFPGLLQKASQLPVPLIGLGELL